MASKRFEVDMGLNATEFTRGAKDAEKAIGKLEDALDDAGAGGARDVDKLESALKDAERQAGRTDSAVGDIRGTVDDVGTTGERGFRRLGDKGAEVSSELKQNLGETFSSFRGDLEDLPQIAQDTLGGLAGSGALGGIPGLAATAAGAAGLGLIIGAMDQMSERAQKVQEDAADLAKAYIDAGSTVLSAIEQAGRVADVVTDPEKYKQAKQYRDLLGVDMPTALDAVAGNLDATNLLWDAYMDKTRKAVETGQQGSPIDIAKMNEARDSIQTLIEVNELAIQSTASYSDYLRGLVNDASSASKEVDNLGNEVYTLPDGMQIMIDAKTGQATADVSKFKGDLDGVPEVVTSTVKVRVDKSDWDNWTPVAKVGGVVSARMGVGIQ